MSENRTQTEDLRVPVVVAEATEGERSEPLGAGAASTGGRAERGSPNPEVSARPSRRKFRAEYKLRIVREADACTKPGEIGALLRREGLYSSLLTMWRRARDRSEFDALKPKKRGPQSKERNPLTKENDRLRRENAQLRGKLEQAELIIDVQKKVSRLLGTPLRGDESDGDDS